MKKILQKTAAVCKYIFLILFAALCLYPFIWVVLSSFKDNNDIFSNPFGLPAVMRWENYQEAWKNADIGNSFFNSLFVCLMSLVILILVTTMGSYVLSRVRPSKSLSMYFSLGIMIPIHALLIPAVILFKNLSMTDSLWGLILMYTAVNISISMFILEGFLEGIPTELDEAATIDGCSRAGIFFRIILPVAKPGIATVATLTFLNCWNELVLGLVLISTPVKRTLSMSISVMKGSFVAQYGALCAGFVVSILPVVCMYLLFQKQVMKGMTAGAVKG